MEYAILVQGIHLDFGTASWNNNPMTSWINAMPSRLEKYITDHISKYVFFSTSLVYIIVEAWEENKNDNQQQKDQNIVSNRLLFLLPFYFGFLKKGMSLKRKTPLP